jgi:thioesterase domain-containing protein
MLIYSFTGWSLGGLLALEVAHILESQSENRNEVIGIVMLDSPYTGPSPVPDPNINVLANRPFLKPTCAPELALLIKRSMRRAGQMVEKWSVPSWATMGVRPPPVILLRCMDMVPVNKKPSQEPFHSIEDDIYSVDRYRTRDLLGWEYLDQPDFVRAVLNVPGHHFSVMAEENVSSFSHSQNSRYMLSHCFVDRDDHQKLDFGMQNAVFGNVWPIGY